MRPDVQSGLQEVEDSQDWPRPASLAILDFGNGDTATESFLMCGWLPFSENTDQLTTSSRRLSSSFCESTRENAKETSLQGLLGFTTSPEWTPNLSQSLLLFRCYYSPHVQIHLVLGSPLCILCFLARGLPWKQHHRISALEIVSRMVTGSDISSEETEAQRRNNTHTGIF